MKPSRLVIKLGLALTIIAAPFVAHAPRIAVALADLGDFVSGLGVHWMCYGY